jgi:hypothetical protein
VDNLESADAATALTDMDTFADNLKTGGFTDCNVGNTKVSVFSGQNAAKPAANVNVDALLIVVFRKGTEEQVRKMTIPGIDVGSTLLEEDSAGLRLTTAGAATLAGYIDALFGWSAQAVIISGKCIVKS